MGSLSGDLRHAVRLLRRSPVFTAVAVLSLALGIGANTAIFTLLNAVVLRKLPVPEPDQLVQLTTTRADTSDGDVSFPAFEQIRKRQQVFSAVVGYWGDGIFNVEAGGRLIRGDVWAVTGNFHSELGVKPFAGRLLTEADVDLDHRQPAMVAVLGYGVWQREFGGSQAVLGQIVRVEGVPFTIVGIAPPGFTAFGITTEPDITVPLIAEPLLVGGTLQRLDTSVSPWVSLTGRLKHGVRLEQARAHLQAMWPSIQSAVVPAAFTGRQRDEFLAARLKVTSAARGREFFLRNRFTAPLYVILGVAGLILLIACVNLASLMLSRAAARSHEMSVRVSLGASRWRLARQMLVEGVMLASCGAALGVLFAAWTSRAIAALITRDFLVPAILDVAPDGRVLAFAAAAGMTAGVLLSIVPAWRVAREDPAGSLRRNARSLTAAARTGKALIVSQVALSLVLLMDTGLLVRSLQRVRHVDVGFTSRGVVTSQLFPRPDGYRDLDGDRYFPELAQRVAALPGVRAATIVKDRPGSGSEFKQRVSAVGEAGDGFQAAFGRTGPGFFGVVDIALVAGRDFSWTDNSRTNRVAILSRSLAERLFPGGAIGRRISVGSDPSQRDIEVVGVVADVRLFNPRNPSPLAVYVPVLQERDSAKWSSLILRMSGGASVSAAALREAVQAGGREFVLSYRTLQQVMDRTILQERVTALLASFFGGLALLLVAVGLYGLMAYGVAQRTREIGIRVALGAQRGQVRRMIVGETLRLVAAGIAVGAPIALVASRFVQSLLFGLATTSDPTTLVGVAFMLLAIGALAGWLPGTRASRIDPMQALRN